MFKRILVGIDGSDHSQKALEVAADISAHYGSELYLVHSPQLDTTAVAVGSGVVAMSGDPASTIEAGKAALEAAAEQAEGLGRPVKETFLGDGIPADDILRFADMTEVDLIVMGRRGLGGIASLFLGSVSQKVSQHAKCTCMTVQR